MIAGWYLILAVAGGIAVELAVVAANLARFGVLVSDEHPTISRVIYRACQRHPWIALLMGMLLWHWLGE